MCELLYKIYTFDMHVISIFFVKLTRFHPAFRYRPEKPWNAKIRFREWCEADTDFREISLRKISWIWMIWMIWFLLWTISSTGLTSSPEDLDVWNQIEFPGRVGSFSIFSVRTFSYVLIFIYRFIHVHTYWCKCIWYICLHITLHKQHNLSYFPTHTYKSSHMYLYIPPCPCVLIHNHRFSVIFTHYPYIMYIFIDLDTFSAYSYIFIHVPMCSYESLHIHPHSNYSFVTMHNNPYIT